MIYPQKLNSKKGEKLLKIFLMVSIILALILIAINRVMKPEIPWAALANCGIIYTWIVVIYSIKRSTNIAGHVLLQTIITSAAMLYIDQKIGFKGWSVNIAIPIILMISNITMLILTVISYKKYVKYAIYQLVIVLLSLISISIIMRDMIEITILSRIVVPISILNLVITLILSYKDVKEAIIRNFHM